MTILLDNENQLTAFMLLIFDQHRSHSLFFTRIVIGASASHTQCPENPELEIAVPVIIDADPANHVHRLHGY